MLKLCRAESCQALGAVADIDADHWWREVEVNLRGPMLCARAVLPDVPHVAVFDTAFHRDLPARR